jgi:hypothetical protein
MNVFRRRAPQSVIAAPGIALVGAAKTSAAPSDVGEAAKRRRMKQRCELVGDVIFGSGGTSIFEEMSRLGIGPERVDSA